MAYALNLRKLAINDIGEAYDWYEDKRQGLGEEFLLSADDAFDILKRNPELFEEKYPAIRKCKAWIIYDAGIDWSNFFLTKSGILIYQKIFDMNPIDYSREGQAEPEINDTIRVGEIFMPVVIPYDSIQQFIPIVK